VTGWPVARLCQVGRAQQHHATLGEESVELGGDVALVSDDRQTIALPGQGVVVKHGHQDLAFVEFRIGQRPGDRKPGRG
jgi:hypothetical protein